MPSSRPMVFGRRASPRARDSPGLYDVNERPLTFTEWGSGAIISAILTELSRFAGTA
jgi:hypothetical protein